MSLPALLISATQQVQKYSNLNNVAYIFTKNTLSKKTYTCIFGCS